MPLTRGNSFGYFFVAEDVRIWIYLAISVAIPNSDFDNGVLGISCWVLAKNAQNRGFVQVEHMSKTAISKQPIANRFLPRLNLEVVEYL
jgi:hypothetical protein